MLCVIEFDDIISSPRRPNLDRADAYAAPEQIMDVIVNDLVVGIVAHEYARRFRSEPSAVSDVVVGHGDPPAMRASRHGGFALESPLGHLA
jgi:hypothetical protein